MAAFTDKTAPPRRDLLIKAITVGVLVLSTCVAWFIVQAKGAQADRERLESIDRGARILARIRRDGLSHYWSPGPQSDWYLRLSKVASGRVSGWVVTGWGAVVRHRRSDGTYEGLNIVFVRKGRTKGMGSWERWELDETASRGDYEAGDFSISNARLVRTVDTKITLDNGKVTMQRPLQKITGQADAPENYVPEGLGDLAYFVGARMGDTARLALLFNSDPPVDGMPQFASAAIREAKQVGRQWHATLELRSARGKSAGTTDLVFGPDGTVLSRTDKQVKQRRVRASDVHQWFPNAPRDLGALLLAVGMTAPDDPGGGDDGGDPNGAVSVLAPRTEAVLLAGRQGRRQDH